MTGHSGVVLVVDDERDVADSYAELLPDAYDVRTAYGGTEALERFDAAVDVVLLDRRMPDLSGDEVLAEIRARSTECRVAMVTAVEPDFDVLAMGFDDYLTKPASRDELVATVERLTTLATYESEIQEYFALATKRATLETQKTESELAANDRYQSLLADLEALDADLDDVVGNLTVKDYKATLHNLTADADDAPDDQR